MFEGSRGVDTVAKFQPEMAFGYQPKLTTKVDYLIDLLQFLNLRLKSRSWDVWDYLENASHPIFFTEFFPVWVQQLPEFVLPPALRVARPKLLTVNFGPSSATIGWGC